MTTVAFEGENGVVTGLRCARVDEKMKPIEGTEFTLQADLVLLAMGFVSPVKEGLLTELGVSLDNEATCSRIRSDTPPHAPRSLLAATCAAASRSSSGRSAKAANAPRRSTRP